MHIIEVMCLDFFLFKKGLFKIYEVYKGTHYYY